MSDVLRARHADLSSTQLRFLDFLAQYPQGHERSHFAPVHVPDGFARFEVQSWPLFLGAARRRCFEQAACAVSRLVRSVPQRFFGNDAAALRQFYSLSNDQAVLIGALLRHTGVCEGAYARCDFLDTAQGIQCVEVNAGNVSGWHTARFLERFAKVPAIRAFVEHEAGEIFYRNPARILFAHLVEEGRKLARDGELNLCFAVGASSLASQVEEYLGQDYQAVLAAAGDGLQGSLITCDLASLKAEKGELHARGRRVHIVHETGVAQLTRPLLAALLARKVLLYNGPASRVLGDKGNLALLSEAVDSDLMSAQERAAIREWIPWTRRVSSGTTKFRGETVSFPTWLLAEREQLVLKARYSLGGKDVVVGRFTTPEQWASVVQQALADGKWVVQEYLPSLPYLFLAESGCVLHDLVWGLFTFGDRFGGNFFRAQEQNPRSRGLVNATQGAGFGLALEVEEGERQGVEFREVSGLLRGHQESSDVPL